MIVKCSCMGEEKWKSVDSAMCRRKCAVWAIIRANPRKIQRQSGDFVENRNLASIVYEKIRDEIVELKVPPGAYLLEREISERLGVSRTPVREAIKRLTQEGWLLAEERRRPIVKGFSIREGRDIFQFRNMAESFALSDAFDRGMERMLAGQLDIHLRKMVETKQDSIRFIRSDIHFHTAIVYFADNRYLSRAWSTVAEEIIRISIYAMDYARTTETVVGEHEALLQHLWNSEKERALSVLIGHHDMIFAGLERQLAQAGCAETSDGG